MSMTVAMIRRIPSALLLAGYRLPQVSARKQISGAGGSTKLGVIHHEPDPFGLTDTDADLSSVVQGLYSSNREIQPSRENQSNPDEQEEPIAIPQQEADPTQVYKTWLDDTRTQRREEKLAQGGEMLHSAPFGLIRLDQDNFPREQEDEDEVLLNQREAPDFNSSENHDKHAGTTSTTKGRRKQHSTTDKSTSGSLNGKIDAILEKSSTVLQVSEPTPSIYQMPSLSDLTHAEMWELLREHVGFQNDFVVAINKPYGLPMHTPSRECRHTVLDFLNELTTYCKSSEKVYPLHRLDKDTTGVLLFAKTQIAATIIKEKFATRQMMKKYLAVVKNCPPMRKGTIDIPIGEGKVGGTDAYRSVLKPNLRKYKIDNSQEGAIPAVTHFQVLRSAEGCSFLEIRPETGIKHQIRIHLGMALGCPVLGDHKYSHRDKLAPQRLSTEVLDRLNVKQSKVRHLPLHLHCSHVEFEMPESFSTNREPVFIHSRPPKYFMHTLRKLWLSKG